jgi:hypothetical protein
MIKAVTSGAVLGVALDMMAEVVNIGDYIQTVGVGAEGH